MSYDTEDEKAVNPFHKHDPATLKHEFYMKNMKFCSLVVVPVGRNVRLLVHTGDMQPCMC
jgi:hypothetical protein